MCHKVGIRPITPHQLRHYFATCALKDSAKLEVISRILGHTSMAITADTYRHVTRSEMHEDLQAHGPLSRVVPPRLLPEGETE